MLVVEPDDGVRMVRKDHIVISRVPEIILTESTIKIRIDRDRKQIPISE